MASQFCVRVGNNIKKYRKETGITLKELGEKIGVQKSAIAKYENGRVKNLKRGVIAKLADALQCSPTYLMGLEEENNDMKLSNIIPITTHKLPMLGEIFCGEPRFTSENRESYVDAGTITLVAENPAYAPMVFTKESQKNVCILGKAIAFQSYVK